MKIRSAGAGASSLLSGQGHHVPVGQLNTHPMAVLLFGKRAPKLVDRRRYPGLKKGLAKLDDMTEQVALMVGRRRADFTLELCEGGNACISRDGQVAFGVDLLAAHQDDDDLLLGVLGHEVGHQPWDWPTGAMGRLTRAQLAALYREEEAKADRFAGRALAELGGSPDAIEAFLHATARGFEENQQLAEYYPPAVRAGMIRGSFERRRRATQHRGRLLGTDER